MMTMIEELNAGRTAMTRREELGAVVARVLAVIDGYASDPMSQAYGYYADPIPEAARVAASMGWTLEAIDTELDARGISPKYIAMSGMSAVLSTTTEVAR